MAEGKTDRRRLLRRLLRWLLPLAILVAIAVSIDVALFLDTLADTNPWIALAGILLLPTRNAIAALRWRMLLAFGFGSAPGTGWVFRQYWTGLALGYFTPSSAGLDVYRIAAATRRTGRLAVNVALVLLEKGLALVSCTVLILAVVPLLPGLRGEQDGLVRQLWLGAWGVLLLAVVALALAALVLRSRLAERIATSAQRLFAHLANKARRSTEVTDPPGEGSAPATDWTDMLGPVLRPGKLGALLGASMAIQLASAAGNHVMFQAAGYDLPFVAHLFVVPVLYILFALPISFGSLGVREGAFIVLYGLFAVPAELALLVSILNLAGIMLNNVIGAGVMALHGRGDKPATGPGAQRARRAGEQPSGGEHR